MTIYLQPKTIDFHSIQYSNGTLTKRKNPISKFIFNDDPLNESTTSSNHLYQIKQSELFDYLIAQKLSAVIFKSQGRIDHSFFCRVTRRNIVMKLKSSLKVLIYELNIESGELFLNKKKVNQGFFESFLGKLNIIAEKAVNGKATVIEEPE